MARLKDLFLAVIIPITYYTIHKIHMRKNSTSSHFADDTTMLLAAKNMKYLGTVLNKELKSVCYWLLASNIETDLKMSHPK